MQLNRHYQNLQAENFTSSLPQTSSFAEFVQKITSFNKYENTTILEMPGIGIIEYTRTYESCKSTYTLTLLGNSICAYHKQVYSHPEISFSFNSKEIYNLSEECKEWLKLVRLKLSLTNDEFIDFVIALDSSAFNHGLPGHLRNFDF